MLTSIDMNKHAAALGQLGGRAGGAKGGRARALALSAERRREIAIGAAKSRWLAVQIVEAKKRLGPLAQQIDPGDLDLILRAIFRPFGDGRRFFLKEIGPDLHVF